MGRLVGSGGFVSPATADLDMGGFDLLNIEEQRFAGGIQIGGESAAAVGSGTDSIAMGRNSDATGTESIAIGGHSVLGAQSTATATIAIGKSNATANYDIAIGQDATGTGGNCVALGRTAEATANTSIAIGSGTGASRTRSIISGGIAIGGSAIAQTGSDAVAIGSSANAQAQNSFQFGSGTNSTANTAQYRNTPFASSNATMTRTQATGVDPAHGSPIAGETIFDTSNDTLHIYNGTAWVSTVLT